MKKLMNSVKIKYAMLAVIVIAALGVGFTQLSPVAHSGNCPGNAPTSPTFNYWPLDYGGADCTDAALIDAKNQSSNDGRDSRYAANQSEHDQGISANVGDAVRIKIYFHNGASDQIDRSGTTARNATVSSSFDTTAGTVHTASATLSASNAATVTSAQKGGNIKINTPSTTALEYIPKTALLCLNYDAAVERGADLNDTCGFNNSTNKPMIAIPISDSINNGSFSLGDLKACFPYSGFLVYSVRVVQAGTTTPPTNSGNPALSITKQVRNVTQGNSFSHNTNANNGDTVEYKVDVKNTGNATATNVTITDPIVSGLNYIGDNGLNTGKNVGSLEAGQTTTLTYQARVNVTSGTITNTATARADNLDAVRDSANVTVTSTPVTPVTLVAPVLTGTPDCVKAVLTWTAVPGATSYQIFRGGTNTPVFTTVTGTSFTDTDVQAGIGWRYDVRAVNANGAGPFSNPVGVTSKDCTTSTTPPTTVTLVAPVLTGTPDCVKAVLTWTAVPGATSYKIYRGGTNTPVFATVTGTSFTDTNVQAGIGWRYDVRAVNANGDGPFSNPVGVTSKDCTVVTTGTPNLSVTKQVRNVTAGQTEFTKTTTAKNGDVVEFKIVGLNSGTADVLNITMVDTLPAGMTGISGLTGGAAVLKAGGSVLFLAQARVNVDSGTLVNTATISNPFHSYSDTATVIVNPTVINNPTFSIGITKSVRNVSAGTNYAKSVNASSGQTVNFQVTVTNNGTGVLNNVNVTDIMPSGLSFVSGTMRLDGSFNNFTVSNGSLALGTLNVGQSRTITFDATVNSGATGSFTNVAQASSSNTGTVQDTATVFVSQVNGGFVNIIQSKRANNDTLNVDATTTPAQKENFITYTLTTQNTGNTPATNYVVSDDLTNVLSLAGMVDLNGGVMNGNVISWPAETIQPGQISTHTFRVRVNFNLPARTGLQLVNTYGNTVVVPIKQGSVLGAVLIAPATGANSMAVGVGIAALLTAGFWVIKRKNLIPSIRFR